MSKQSKINYFFKAKVADQLEVEELLFTTMETTRSINSIATSIRSIIDTHFANIGSLFQQYDSDFDNLETI